MCNFAIACNWHSIWCTCALLALISTCSYCTSLIVHYAWPESCDLWHNQLMNMTPSPHQLNSRERGDFKEDEKEIEPIVTQKLEQWEERLAERRVRDKARRAAQSEEHRWRRASDKAHCAAETAEQREERLAERRVIDRDFPGVWVAVSTPTVSFC